MLSFSKKFFHQMRLRRTLSAVIGSSLLAIAFGGAAAKDKDEDEEALKTPYQIVNEAPDDVWRTIKPENMLVMDLPSGEIIIELRPDFAPNHVERIKELTRAGFYDGLKFHRVIEGFVAQGGDPKGDGTGGSELPNLEAEFFSDSSEVQKFDRIGRDRVAAQIGFVEGMPVAAEPEALRSFRADRRVMLWPAHCPGVMSMARATPPNSANSQFFLMIGDARDSLDQRYSVWGLIVDGVENSRRIIRGEPPVRPTPIVRMRIGSDVPAEELPKVEIIDTSHEVFAKFLKRAQYVNDDGLVKDLCSIRTPRRVNGKVEL